MIFPENVRLLTTPRYIDGGAGCGCYDNFNLADYVGDNEAAVAQNRELLMQRFDLPTQPKWLKQTHSDTCLDAGLMADCAAGDATFTDEVGVVCAILTADCLPIFAANKSGTKVGLAHAGWQGILNGVIEEFVDKLDDDLLVHFGAAISQAALELDEPIYQQFAAKNATLKTAFVAKNDKYYLDIYGAAKIILNEKGVNNISGGEHCTYAENERYFSFRRDGARSGRLGHFIWLV